MQRKATSILGAAVAVAGLTFGAIAIANAADARSSDVASADDSGTANDGQCGRGHDETPLTGTQAEQATAAAQAAVADGTVVWVETDGEGAFEAHVRKADGKMVEVKMDSNFTVTSVEERVGRGPGGRGHGRGPSYDQSTDDSGTGSGSARSSSFDA